MYSYNSSVQNHTIEWMNENCLCYKSIQYQDQQESESENTFENIPLDLNI